METFLLFALIVKHFVVDFGMQTEYQWKNKGNIKHPGGYLHVGLHLIGTLLVIAAVAAVYGVYFPVLLIWGVAMFEAVTHYATDWSKVNICKNMGWKPDNSPYFWHMVGLDQLIHILVILTMFVWVMQ